MSKYPKIAGPFKRYTDGPHKNQLIEGEWTSPELELLANNDWPFIWTEKIDGTNVRAYWDGHAWSFRGRTDNASMPPRLLDILQENFVEELAEQQFGETPAIIYGEGFGGRIQKGGVYSPVERFVMFDVMIGGIWLQRDSLENISRGLDLELIYQLHDHGEWEFSLLYVIDWIKAGMGSHYRVDGGQAEGAVGIPVGGFLDRQGQRIQIKVKGKDFAN